MNALIIPAVMLLTILLVFAGGIGLSFMAANALLRAMARRPQKEQSAALTTAAANSSGD